MEKYYVYNFSEYTQHQKIFWKINERNLINYQHRLNASWSDGSKLLNFLFYLTHKSMMYLIR